MPKKPKPKYWSKNIEESGVKIRIFEHPLSSALHYSVIRDGRKARKSLRTGDKTLAEQEGQGHCPRASTGTSHGRGSTQSEPRADFRPLSPGEAASTVWSAGQAGGNPHGPLYGGLGRSLRGSESVTVPHRPICR